MSDRKKYAIIDIGSNSIRCLFQGAADKCGVTTRLGTGLSQTGKLDNAHAKQSAFVVAEFAKTARRSGFIPLAYATSAVRDAQNRDEFLQLVKLLSGIDVDVISGEAEAGYAYRAAAKDGGGLIDIGGASMQFSSETFKKSFPAGCVRGRDIALELTGKYDCDDGFSVQREALRGYLEPLVAPYLDAIRASRFTPLVGVGGSITALVSLSYDITLFDKRLAHGKTMTYDALQNLIKTLIDMSSARIAHPVMKKRHDVILYGAILLEFAMELLGANEITSSIVDGLDGYLDAAINGELDR